MPREVHVSGVGGGGFAPIFDPLESYFTDYRSGGVTTGVHRYNGGTITAVSGGLISVNSEYYFFEMNAGSLHFDPGWLKGTTHVDPGYWGVTFPANTVFELPVGVYRWAWYFSLESVVPPDGVVYGGIDYAEDYLSNGGAIENSYAVVFETGGIPNDMNLYPNASWSSGMITVDTDDTPFVPYIGTYPASAPNDNVQNYEFWLVKVA